MRKSDFMHLPPEVIFMNEETIARIIKAILGPSNFAAPNFLLLMPGKQDGHQAKLLAVRRVTNDNSSIAHGTLFTDFKTIAEQIMVNVAGSSVSSKRSVISVVCWNAIVAPQNFL
jgi:hypothetical protein